MIRVTLASLFLLVHLMSIKALTPYDDPWTEECASGHSIYRVRSSHSNHHEDRRWSFSCRYDRKIGSSCQWSGYVNNYDQSILYQCPNGVIAGLHSKHHNHYEDRRFSFKCCFTQMNYQQNCRWTGNVNDWNRRMDYTVPKGYFLTGAKSFHNNRKEDRLWRFLICQHM